MANLTENLKDSMTATFPREFDIPNAMTIQEIYDKLNARAAAFQMPFSVKGGIPGERVVFEKEPNLDVIIWLHVKNGTHIKITPVTQDSSAKINGIDVGKTQGRQGRGQQTAAAGPVHRRCDRHHQEDPCRRDGSRLCSARGNARRG